MKYLKAEIEQIDIIYELVQKTITEVYPRYYLKEIVEMFKKHHSKENILRDIHQGDLYILILDDNSIIGTGTADKNHITRVYVLPEYQGQGYGSYIIEQLENRISKEYEKAQIDSSLPACKLYEKLGYRTINHEICNCDNGVILVYGIMEKDIKKKELSSLRLRQYKPCDGAEIVTWCKDEYSFRKWCSDRWKTYPLSVDEMNHKYWENNGDCLEEDNFYPMTLVDNNKVVGHLILRYTDKNKQIIRFGFVIVDDKIRGKGYGKKLLALAKKYSFEILNAKKVTLGVFENNPKAYYCYKAAGFKEIPLEEDIYYEIFDEKWKCIEMEALL